MAVNTHRHIHICFPENGDRCLDDASDLSGQRAAIGVAQHDARRPGLRRSEDRFLRVVGIQLPAIEEVFCVVKHFAAAGRKISHGVCDHGNIFISRHAEHFGDVECRCLTDDCDHTGASIEKSLHAWIGGGSNPATASHAKGNDSGVNQREFLHTGKILRVLWIGKRIAPLNEIDPGRVEPLGNGELVFQ